MNEEEYEIIPVNPLRRLEKRIDKLENFSGDDPKTIFRDIMDIVKMNQQIVDEMARSNDSLRIELSKIPGKMEELIGELRELITFIKSSGESETNVNIGPEIMKPVVDRLDALVTENKSFTTKNEVMLDVLDEINKRLKRTTVQSNPMSRPPMPMPPLMQPAPMSAQQQNQLQFKKMR